MATSPHSLNSPLEFLPVTRFLDSRADSLHDVMIETQKERSLIQAQPYRTTQLVFPNPKIKPDLIKTKLTGRKATAFRPLDQRTLVTHLNENQSLVHRQQYNNPRRLYSNQNVQEAIFVQTGVNFTSPPQYNAPHPLQQQRQPTHALGPPVRRTPDSIPEFKPQNSPTYRAILEEEGPGIAMPAVSEKVAIKAAHYTAPSYQLNSVGMPSDRIAQSGSFKRLMYHVQGV